jgi:hypothetical protein
MEKKGRFFFLVALFFLILIGIWLRIKSLDSIIFNEWIARDFDRAFNIVDGIYIPLAGPEVNTGGRLPGPFMYFFLAIPLLINHSYESLFVFNFFLNIASILGLFLILKKYFDIFVAGITTALVSINFLSIIAVAFPINPSFLFPFIVLFLWLILEFGLKDNIRAVPLIALIFSLAVQFHYSIATYFLIPVIIGLLFKIRISFKYIIASVLIVIVCISPYLIHKKNSFTPQNAGLKETLAFQKFSSPWVNFKNITLLHNFHYLSKVKTNFIGGPQLPKAISSTMSIFTCVAFYTVLLVTVISSLNNGWRSRKKEIVVLIFFWTPAFIYGLVNPITHHFWYAFIFVIPQALLISVFISSLYRFILTYPYKVIYIVCICCLVGTLTYNLINHTNTVLKEVNRDLFGTKYTTGTYDNTQLMIMTLNKDLKLSENDLYERLYIVGHHLLSKRRLKNIGHNSHKSKNKSLDATQPHCFFILSKDKDYEKSQNQNGRIIQTFLNDKTVNIISIKNISLSKIGFEESLKIYTYIPIEKQACYNNTFNPFVTTKSIHDLLIAAKEITLKNEGTNLKILSEKMIFNAEKNLDSMSATYAVNNQISQSPFYIKVTINKSPGGYTVKGEVELYSFFMAPNFDMEFLDIVFKKIPTNEPIKQYEANEFSSIPTNNYVVNILTPKTIANYLNINSTHKFNYNQSWFRESFVPVKLKKGKFNIYLRWALNCSEYPIEPACPLKLNNKNKFSLKLFPRHIVN